MIASVGGQSNAYTTDDETVFWETVPAQYLPLMLWLEADRMATLRIDKDTFANERDVVKEERRMRVDNQPYGRLNEIIYDQAFTVAPVQARDDRQHGGSRGGVGRGRARLLQDVLRAGERDAGARRRLRFGAGAAAGQPVPRAACRRPTAPVPRDIPQGAAADEREAASRCRSRGRCRPSSSRITSPTTATPIRIRCTSRPRCCPTARARASTRSWSTRQQLAVAAFGSAEPDRGSEPVLRRGDRVSPGHTPEEVADALIAEFDRLKSRADHRRTSCSARRTSSRATTSWDASRTSRRPRQLSHAVVIHHDIKTADGEFDIFQNMTAADVQRVAQHLLHDRRTAWC